LNLAVCYSRAEQRRRWAANLTAARAQLDSGERENFEQFLGDPSFFELAIAVRDWRQKQQRFISGASLLSDRDSLQLVEKRFGPETVLPLTAIEDYRSCPYRFFFKNLLRIRPLLKPQLRPGGMDLGNLYHQILQEFGEENRDQVLISDRRDEYQKLLTDLFQNCFREWQETAASELDRFILTIQENQIRQTLERWLNSELHWAEMTRGGFKIHRLEFAFGLERGEMDPASVPEPYQLDWSDTQVRICGKVDRVDINSQGEFVVYDYKLGQGYSGKKMLELEYLQIPVYLLALEQRAFGTGRGIGGSYLGLKNPDRKKTGLWRQKDLTGEMGKATIPEEELQDWLDRTKNEVVVVARAIRAGSFPPAKAERCLTYCEYKDSCRKQEWEVGYNHGQGVE
jgi:ATP-dependent helicase/DNAse subunit B